VTVEAEQPTTTHMQIGQVAERTEVSIRTLRHWEESGLVTPSARSAGGFRLYTEGDVERLRTIRRMKPLGFTLDEMKQLLASLEVLADAAVDDDARGRAAAFVSDCHTRAEDSCTTLRRQLAYAEEFRDLLADRT
jgi:MerR family copper efflux transcriptional regulator